ncbi:uncharacterized protein LOC129748427 [Uranotaenia lowii]|uniref:uncharacterized protein LOC129748427 n=1 Tax=Uranotaenia lowii TaxID=190385 RepID=UPI00247B05B9|nr:uncharacterized protein LOC129748427 [Uranotaenia lowii]
MNRLQTSFIILVIASAVLGIFADYTADQTARFATIAKKCYQELDFPADSDIIRRISINEKPEDFDDQRVKELMVCGTKELGWLDSDGIFQKQVFLDFFGTGYAQEAKLKEVTDRCVDDNHLNNLAKPTDRIYNFHRCFFGTKQFEL